MEKSEKPRPVMNTLMNVAALVSVVALIGFFVWHSTQYMELIFEKSGSGPGDLYRGLAAGFVEAACIGGLVWVVYRGTGQGDDDDPDEKKTPAGPGGITN